MRRRSGVDISSMLGLIDLTDYIVAHTIRAVAELGVADAVAAGPRSITDIAIEVDADPAALSRALRALASVGVFTELDDGRFGLTPQAEPLRQDHPASVRAALALVPEQLFAWGAFTDTIRTGQAAYSAVHGETLADRLRAYPADRARYDAAQRAPGGAESCEAQNGYPWGSVGHVVEIAAGGALVLNLVNAHPHLTATIVDDEAALADAAQLAAAAGVADRITLQSGAVLPTQADAYLLYRVLLARSDAEARRMLTRVAAAAGSGSRVLIFEPTRVEGEPLDRYGMVDLFQLAFTGGRVRTKDQLAALLADAGLDLRATHRTSLFPLLEAVPR